MSRPEAMLLFLVWVFCGLALVGCGGEEERADELLPAVAVAEVTPVDFDEEIRASGDLEARLHTIISAEIAGRVTELAIDEGGSVEHGAIVIEIDPERRQLDLSAARARLAQARAELRKQRSRTNRIRKLRSESISSVQQLEEEETALLLAQSAVDAELSAVGVAERAVSDASVSAPFAGLVARREVQLGEFVQVGTPLFELVSLDPLEAIFSLTELDTERVRMDQKVEVRVGAFPSRVFEGTVTFVAPTVDPATRTLRIKAEIDNAEGLLRPGLFARVSLGVAHREGVLMVPEEAILQRAGGTSVYRVGEGDRVERVVVETGAIQEGLVEIRGPIRAGDLIVRRGHGGLADGMVVAVRSGRRTSVAPPPTKPASEPESGPPAEVVASGAPQ